MQIRVKLNNFCFSLLLILLLMLADDVVQLRECQPSDTRYRARAHANLSPKTDINHMTKWKRNIFVQRAGDEKERKKGKGFSLNQSIVAFDIARPQTKTKTPPFQSEQTELSTKWTCVNYSRFGAAPVHHTHRQGSTVSKMRWNLFYFSPSFFFLSEIWLFFTHRILFCIFFFFLFAIFFFCSAMKVISCLVS